MAVDAVASVVIQKLRNLISEESFVLNKVIGNQLTEMQLALEEMRGFFIDASDKEATASDGSIKNWTDDYLLHLYYVEDIIESFALRITRQRKRPGFLMNYALFLKNFTACGMLSRKLKKIQRKFVVLKNHTPDGVEDASLRSTHSQRSDSTISLYDWVTSENPEGEGEVERGGGEGEGEGAMLEKSSSLVLEIDDLIRNQRRSVDSASTISIGDGYRRSLPSGNSISMQSRSSDDSILRDRWRQSKLMFSYSYGEKELEIVGFEQDVAELLSRLTKENCSEQIVSIVGEVGSGKTTLTRAVYGNLSIKNSFQPSAWVTFSKDCSLKYILLQLLKQVEKSAEQGSEDSEDSLKTRLRQHLKHEKFLIVLDGVESSDQWENLKNAFPDDDINGSKIIITTCVCKLARLADPKSLPHNLKKLDDETSWNLFLRKMGIEDPGDSSLKNKVIDVCNGLPLNIVLLGSLLSTKKHQYREWTSILNKQENWKTDDILRLCYNDLDAHLKLCLLYLMLFPKEYDIPIRRLLRLWLTEGFVKQPQSQYKFQEDVVQEYFDNLVKRSLILVSKLRSDGSPRKCRLLGVLHEYLLSKVEDISLFHVHHHSSCPQDVAGPHGKRRLIEYADAKNCSLSFSQYQHLRSYISFNVQKKDTEAKDVRNLLSNVIGKGFGLLRVLDLEGVYKPSLPDNLGDLFHLRYLGLRWTFLDKLPKSVGSLPALETLDLKHTYIYRIPASIWKLKKLRHLNLNENHLDKDMILHCRGGLPQLLTLWGLCVDQECPIKNGLSRLTNLRELGISFRSNDCDEADSCCVKNSPTTAPQFTEDVLTWITKLTDLQSLRLRSKDDMGNPSDLNLKPLSSLTKLSHLNLLGKLQKLPERDHFPPNIKVLTLSVSRLGNDPMPILGQLPSLTVLRLLANSYLGENITCPQGTFKELRVLKLWMLKDLSKWELKEGAMEKLKELNIRYCLKLENIPGRLFHQTSFKDLILTNMPETFRRNAQMKSYSRVSITVKDYNFSSLPWEQEDDLRNGVASNTHCYINGGT